ncbi:MAG: Unknown protein [uncultured Sulfurovum sp.]|uniref:Uncharacterized protein n=1 Tax=uncultured Sulfurovum sp. TaxID=269237 RepID=A0A6S6T291_9BACT|nr:MAG: Unknown protein [uncultured Sulfurovum sp.]
MKQNIFVALTILLFMGCSEKEPTPEVPKKEKVDIRMSQADKNRVEEFVPEHIKRSKIEVVERP